MTFVTKRVDKLTKDEYAACRRLNMGIRGEMRRDLVACRTHGYPARAVMCWERGQLQGWALIQEREAFVYVYVRSTERRRGIGKELMRRALRRKAKLTAFPWDTASTQFFGRYADKVNLVPH